MIPVEKNYVYKMGQYLNGNEDEVQFAMFKLQGVIGQSNLNPLAEE